MNKIKEKTSDLKVMYQILGAIAAENPGIRVFNRQLALKYLSRFLIKPLYALQSVQQSLENYLHRIYSAMLQNKMSKQIDPVRILKHLEQFGPSKEVYKAHCLKLYYTSGIEYMGRECRAWDLIMAINATFKMLETETAPIVIKVQSIGENCTKMTYYSGSANDNIPSDECVAMPFPLQEIILFYVRGVLMLATEYRRIT